MQDLKKKAPELREKILSFEAVLRQYPDAIIGDNPACPLKHSFCEGFYVRQITIPAGMVCVGKIHRHAHPYFILKGDVTVITEEGRQRLKAPWSALSPAGTKRVVVTHEETVWVTVHLNPTNTQDLQELEAQIIAPDYEALEAPVKSLSLNQAVNQVL